MLLSHFDRRGLATIFVVEDDADLGLALWQFLEEEVFYSVVLSPDGFAALKLVRSIIPHLFLLDYNLPGMKDLELVDHLLATSNGEHTPIFLMSARMPREGVWEQLRVLPKPFRFKDLLRLVNEQLSPETSHSR